MLDTYLTVKLVVLQNYKNYFTLEFAGSVMVSCRIVVPVTRVRFPASEFFFPFYQFFT